MRPLARAAIALGLAGVATVAVAPSYARATTLDPSTAPADVKRAREEGLDAFCRKPERPLSRRARALCPIAGEIEDCKAFVDACAEDDAAKSPSDESREHKSPEVASEAVKKLLASLGQVMLWLLVVGIIAAIAVPVVQAILKARRDREVADEAPKGDAPIAEGPVAVELPTETDAELLLRRAEELARGGELDRATVAYLDAALRALDQRGVIRLARHRTHGEYVRACKDPAARPPLREIVREVDRVLYNDEVPTHDTVRRVAARAAALVHAAPIALFAIVLALATTGCHGGRGPTPRTADPAGDDLMIEVLKRQGMSVARLGGSLATLPMPKSGEPSPVVVVDAERTALEDDTRAHLARWVEAGGTLVLAGDPAEWPQALGAKARRGSSTQVTVAIPVDEEDVDPSEMQTRFEHATIARPSALAWDGKEVELASLKSGEGYAATRALGEGVVLGIANDDLFTNAALAREGNAAALVALLGVVDRAHEFKLARPEDGISPPTNPVSALQRAGLGLGLWHALAAALVLFLAVGIRQARAKPTPPPQRRAFAEHVEATGALYARTHAAAHALAAYARYADERLRARMPRGAADPAAFLALRSGANEAECAAVWARAIAARTTDGPRGDELATLKKLSALVSRALAD